MQEVVFVGLSGITHHYGGLSPDNVASDLSHGNESNPRQAALQVLALARHLLSLGVVVAILPPQLRPHLQYLQKKGFDLRSAPLEELEKASSSSFMWAANAATITSQNDSEDVKMHLTVANLQVNQHRRIEAQATYHIFSQIFQHVPDVLVHPPLNALDGFRDEGAANHMRLSPSHDAIGLNVFVYGKRQNLLASEEIATTHHVPPTQSLFLQQNQNVINKGAFHNDVIAVSNENLLLVHECAYENGMTDIKSIETTYKVLYPQDNLQLVIINEEDLSVEESVQSYFFNSQVLTKKNGKMAVIAPLELKILYGGKAAKLMEKICVSTDNSIDEVQYLDLQQSMKNGGGPACLRLRVLLAKEQIIALSEHTGVLANEKLLTALEGIIRRYYPEKLVSEDLRKSEFYHNGQISLIEMEQLMLINMLLY